jgi:integrase
MISPVDRYVLASKRPNTQRSYASALKHFEQHWGGLLPASTAQVAAYLAAYADTLSPNTLQVRLAALAQWHLAQGFVDPTKDPLIRQVLKGIRTLHPSQETQAEPLPLRVLETCIAWLEAEAGQSIEVGDEGRLLRCQRDRALILLGFWRAFRSEELCRLEVPFIQARRDEGMTIFLPWSKADRDNQGRTYSTPALKRLCPVEAYLDWLDTAGICDGPVFRGIDRWGRLSAQALHPYSIGHILRHTLIRSGGEGELYSSHSLRRGFATWASASGWDQKSLMSYVGWRDAKSALRYIEARPDFSSL